MSNLIIKLVFCFCVVNNVFAADPRPDKRAYNPEKTFQLQQLLERTRDEQQWRRNSKLMARLVKTGANPNIKRRTYEYLTLIGAASCYDDQEFTQLLIDYDADVNAIDGNHETAIFRANSVAQAALLKKNGADFTHKELFGRNVLHQAAMRNKNPALMAYYSNFIDLDEEDIHGSFPLWRIVSFYKYHDKTVAEINVKILLLANTDIYKKNKYGKVLTLAAVERQMHDAVEPIADFIARLPLLQEPRKQLLQDLLTNAGYLAGIAGLSQIVVDYSGPPGVSMEEVERLTRETMLLREQKDKNVENKSVKKNSCGCVIS